MTGYVLAAIGGWVLWVLLKDETPAERKEMLFAFVQFCFCAALGIGYMIGFVLGMRWLDQFGIHGFVEYLIFMGVTFAGIFAIVALGKFFGFGPDKETDV